jgi:hypothetical protein
LGADGGPAEVAAQGLAAIKGAALDVVGFFEGRVAYGHPCPRGHKGLAHGLAQAAGAALALLALLCMLVLLRSLKVDVSACAELQVFVCPCRAAMQLDVLPSLEHGVDTRPIALKGAAGAFKLVGGGDDLLEGVFLDLHPGMLLVLGLFTGFEVDVAPLGMGAEQAFLAGDDAGSGLDVAQARAKSCTTGVRQRYFSSLLAGC